MTDTGRVPGEGLPEDAGMVAQPGIPAPDAYTFLEPSEGAAEDDDLLLMPGAQGAWSDHQTAPAPQVQQAPQIHQMQQQSQAQQQHMLQTSEMPQAQLPEQAPGIPHAMQTQHVPQAPGTAEPQAGIQAQPQPQPQVSQGSEPGAHEAGGRDSGSIDLSGVRTPPAPVSAPTPPPARRPLHLGPPMPDTTGGVVRSLADRGPAVGAVTTPQNPAPARHAGPPTTGPEYLDIPRDEAAALPGPQLGVIPSQAAAPWPQPQAPQMPQETPAETVVPEAMVSQPRDQAAPEAAAEAVPTPVAEEPVSAPADPAPVAAAEPEPVVPEPVVAAEPEPVAPEPVVAPEPAASEPVAPEPVAVAEPEPVVAPEPVAPEPAAVAEPEPVVPEPVVAPEPAASEPVAPEPVAVAEPEPVVAPEPVAPEPVVAPEPAASEPVAPEPVAVAEPEPVVAPEPVAPEPAAVAEPEPVVPEPVVAPEPAASEPVAPEPVAPEPQQSEQPQPQPVSQEPQPAGQFVPVEGSLPAAPLPAEAPAVESQPQPQPQPQPVAVVPLVAPEPEAPEAEAAPAPAPALIPEPAEAPAPAPEPDPVAVPAPEEPLAEQPVAEPAAPVTEPAPTPVPAADPEPEPAQEQLAEPGTEPEPAATVPTSAPHDAGPAAELPVQPEPEPEPEPAAEATAAPEPEAAPETTPEPEPEVSEAVSAPAPGYDDAEREAVLRVMRERRDIRNGFRSDPIPHEVLLRVLEAAHTAPSVGHSQPWDFVVIRSAETRRTMHELAVRQRDAYAKSLPKGRAKQFKEMKIEAILDTPVNIVVTADPTRGGRHTLGRHTQPQMAPYSSALAVENLWLAARAEGLGVGWVSFFDEREMVRALGLPEHLEVVAYLCVGYVDEFPEEPELMQAGWSKRRPLSWVVHEETYGRRALPGEEPHDLLQETVSNIRPLDAKALGEAWERQKRMTKPAGALGMLEIISAQLSGLSRMCPPPIPEPAAVAVFAGDHGVHAQGVTAWPQEVTSQMVANFLGGGAVCNAFANQVGAEVCVVDVGVAGELPATPGLLPRKVRAGTADFTTGPALTHEEVLAAIEVGIETARDLVAAGNKALLTGEMGIANTTVSAALVAVYTGLDPAEITGRGTGINDEMHARKVDVVRRALELHQPDPADPIGVLAAVGGLEHAALVGFLLGGASLRTPVILDGVSAGAAALVARAIAPEALAACIAGHRSAEPGHVAALNKLGLRPLVDLDLRLGEGTGALLALPVVQSAARAMHEVATFDSAGVTEK
ncbi:nicotinate-nucleotide--dimethylbenzimidazole phosphoribosyltransferase [Streptomyces sp. Wb2n-11]|uniref:nicotinate-nucleotide--dimethylbenzimidazole phosphoribosyltransferase n=1 Tax=Streptomyces sp. Wb2n-11 TaxID=1030533 RepID=UPI000B8768B1|nr:nicotinate-nucleotide--dimethylbenzimidazole phosphoribosyltransferase [Streptomyces sp. Wb2n-11]